MSTTPRPLPKTPPCLTFSQPADVCSYRPLPTPPLQSANSYPTSSIESVCPRTPPSRTVSLVDSPPPSHTPRNSGSFSSLTSLSSISSEPLSEPRPRLRIAVTPPTLEKRNSFDSPTVRSPAPYDPGQMLSPVVNHITGSSRRIARASTRFGQVPATSSIISPMTFRRPTIIIEPDICESDEDECIPPLHIPQPKDDIPDRIDIVRPPRELPPSKFTNHVGKYPAAGIEAAIHVSNDSDEDRETGSLDRPITPIDLSEDEKFYRSTKMNWKSLPRIVKVAMKPSTFRPESRSTKARDVPIAIAGRVSQVSSPSDQAWYKERAGWRWVERDIGEVVAELRRLR